jgi:serine/threonine protein kinase/predicted ATPase
MTDKIIGERYTLQNQLGAGGMGTVYLGRDVRSQQMVAIKQLKSEIATPEAIERFRREGEALRDLNHPNIVKMLDMFEHDGQHYLVMEYVSGGDLSDLIKTGDIPLETVLTLAIDLADALTRAHKLNIIHRDLKPENVLIGDDGVLRLTDFGIARIGSQGRVTETGLVMGTLPYMPPEAFDDVSIDTRYDVWAFGVILFELLAGQRPFDDNGLIANILSAPLPDLEALCPDAPIALVDLIYRMLERNIDARIPSVRIVGAELEAIQQGRTHQKPQQTQRFDVDIPEFMTLSKHNLPAQMTPFVGREHELDELEKLLKDPTMRLITILAQGGMGKTRLSLELAQRAVDANLYADGVYFVELAPLTAAENIPNAIGDACGFQFLGEGTPKEQLLSILKDRQTLLVIDNYEHLSDGFALVTDILQSAPTVEIIATSRQQLSQAGETLFYLSGMDFPDFETPEDALDYAAVKLFMNSAKRANPSFELREDNLDYVARICKLVQGMPLGIVLAASWLTLLDVSEIANEIQGGLDFLETDETTLPERQRNIRAVMDYSWGQMTEAEQHVFMKLSVFRGGFMRDAAQAVAGANLRILMSLTKKSFIRRDADSGRYEIHELLRQYAEEHLQLIGESEAILERHTDYFAEFLAIRTPQIKGQRQGESVREIEGDFSNIRKAWDYAVNHTNYEALDRMMETLSLYVDMCAMYKVGEELFEKAVDYLMPLNPSEIHPVFNRLRVRYVQVWILQGHAPIPDHIYELLGDCISIAEQYSDSMTTMLCSWSRVELAKQRGEVDVALNAHKHTRILTQKLNEPYYEGRILRAVDWIDVFFHHTVSGIPIEISRQHQELLLKIQDVNGLSHAHFYHALRARGDGTVDQAVDALQKAMAGWRSTNENKSLGIAIYVMGDISFRQGEIELGEAMMIQSKEIMLKMNFLGNEPKNYAIRSLVKTIQRQYDSSRDYIHKALNYGNSPEFMINIYISRAFLAIALGEYERAKSHLDQVIFYRTHTHISESIDILLISAFLIDHNHEYTRVVECLGLAFNIKPEITGWMDKWDLLTQLQADLRTQLGDEAYNTAWERGKSLDLETVIQDLIAEFGEDG